MPLCSTASQGRQTPHGSAPQAPAVDVPILSPAASAAILLYLVYPIVRQVALALSLDPDTPQTLSKVTSTL